MSKKINLKFLITPLLAAVYPVIFYWSVNINQVAADQVLRSLLLAGALGLVVYILLWVITRNPIRASLLGAITLLLFFSYGHIYQWFVTREVIWMRHTYLLPLFILILVGVAFLVRRSGRNLAVWPVFLNIIFLVLILYSVFPIARQVIEDARAETSLPPPGAFAGDSTLPDIYLIVLDEYPRADVLQKTFQFDNSPFIDELSSLGFKVIPCTQSNYRWTIQSLYAMLNLEYAPPDPNDNFDYTYQPITNKLSSDIKNGFLVNSLRSKGYKVVAFETGYEFTELDKADVFMNSNREESFSPFEIGLIDTTMLSAVDDLAARVFGTVSGSSKRLPRTLRGNPRYAYNIKMDGFDNLDKSLQLSGPKFVFAHLLGTHFPIAVDKNGGFNYTKGMPPAGYLGQLEYTNQRVLSSLRELLQDTAHPPIVILLSDHGLKYDDFDTTGEYTDSLLNFAAVYGPAELTGGLYDTITPVNIMRLTATNLGLGTYELLPDHSFYNDPDSAALLDFQNTCRVKP
jgi:hypothetical protein